MVKLNDVVAGAMRPLGRRPPVRRRAAVGARGPALGAGGRAAARRAPSPAVAPAAPS